MRREMRDLVDLIHILDKLCQRGPNKTFMNKVIASRLSAADAFTLGHSAALLDVIRFLKEEKVRASKQVA
jgi:hypothetical protein